MYNPVHRLIHIISSVTNNISNIDIHTKMQIYQSLNTYAIDTIKHNIKLQEKIDNLEYEINSIKENIKENTKK